MSAALANHQFRLAARLVGMVKPGDWNSASESVREMTGGEILIKVLYLSIDPAMRSWINEGKSYIRPVAIDEVKSCGPAGSQSHCVKISGLLGR